MCYYNYMAIVIVIIWPHRSYADTSEFGIGYDVGMAQLIGNETLKSADQSYHRQEKSAQSIFSSHLRVGLGLSFTTTLWFRLGMTYHQQELSPVEGDIICLDPLQKIERDRDQSLMGSEQCLKQSLSVNRLIGLADIGLTYKPFDHVSPLFEFTLGAFYIPHHEVWLDLRRLNEAEEWAIIDRSEKVVFAGEVRPLIKLGIGLERRIFNQWGIKSLLWSQSDLSGRHNSLKDSMTIGVDLSIIHYDYIRLL